MTDIDFAILNVDALQIVNIFTIYAILSYSFKNYENRHLLASNIVSLMCCWRYIAYKNTSHVISYYWYDLVLSIIKRDKLMILHHLFTLYALAHTILHPDYQVIVDVMYAVKCSDIFIHFDKIVKNLEFVNTMSDLFRLTTILLTYVLWIKYRLIYIITYIPYLKTNTNVILAILFVCICAVWLCGLNNTVGELKKRIILQI